MKYMPVDKFGYYSLLEPYIGAYYETGATDKAGRLFKKISVKYQEKLKYYKGLTEVNQMKYGQDIFNDIERYKALIMILARYDEDFAEKEFMTFNSYRKLFAVLFGGEVATPERRERDLEGIVDELIEENTKDSIRDIVVPVDTQE
uniref:hypothetical protein n=1 Tax=Lacinutrix neustonica TaxID=2980107 RepID=UPI0036F2C0D6